MGRRAIRGRKTVGREMERCADHIEASKLFLDLLG
jgi:hypothetical protein